MLDRFAPLLLPWTRCAVCNGRLAGVAELDWHGAHGRRLDALVVAAMNAAPAAPGTAPPWP